ncbi:MAG: 2TM domain-containing protein [Coleofasciculus sp. G1-WW12-02]|uniref:2TM domain-containing protein n=1 Tax=unclassified Coleofasciculus TaxID=2692782 RepID=UPI003304F189
MSVSEHTIIQSYNQEDLQQILNLAITRQANGDEFSRTQLVEIAAELGISPTNLQLAEQEWRLQQEQQQKRQEFEQYQRSQLKQRFGKYIIVNSFLVAINLLSAGQLSWALYILLFWGTGLGLKTWNIYQLHGEAYEKAFQKWYRQQQFNQLTQSIFTRLNNWIKAMG